MGVLAGSPSAAGRGYADLVDAKSEIREFLTSRRAKLTPDEVGLTSYGPRRVPGLRREEVAVLAGVSVPYYTRLERGNLSGVSESVLEALARALQLDDAERAHLFDLARAAQPTTPARRRPRKERIRPSVQRMLDAITGAPAAVLNSRLDMLATNTLARGLYSEMYIDPVRPVNTRAVRLPQPARPGLLRRLGARRQTTPSPSSAPRPAAIPTTAICRTSSASSRPAARSSAPAGPRTTSASTAPARRRSTTRSSATSA